MTPILAAFWIEPFLLFLVWAGLAVMAMWMFQKTKSKPNMLMMIGAGLLALGALVTAFSAMPSTFMMFWVPFAGAIVVTAAFYLTAKPVVDAQLDVLKKKLQDATKEKAPVPFCGSSSIGLRSKLPKPS